MDIDLRDPVWLIILTAVLTNLPKITELIKVIGEKLLPSIFKVKTAREEISAKYQAEQVNLLAKFLDEEQAERKEERERNTERIIRLAEENAALGRRVYIVLEGNQKQQSSVVTALMTVAEMQRASTGRLDRLDQTVSDLIQVCRQGDRRRRPPGETDSPH